MYFGSKNSAFKKNVLKSIKNKIDRQYLRNKSQKLFDSRRVISYELLIRISQDEFVCGNNAWGYNKYRNDMYFYKNFFKGYNDKNFEKNTFNLLIQAKNKTPQHSKERKLPFKQITRDSHEPALVGSDVKYSNKSDFQGYMGRKMDRGPYNYNFCNKTKVDFFKGPTSEAKEIIKKGYKDLFSYSFAYGYIDSVANIIFRRGKLDQSEFEKPNYIYSADTLENRKYLKSKKVKLFSKLFKLSHVESLKIIDDIEKSIFESTLANFLLIKEENYFAYTQVDDQVSERTGENHTEGTLDFLDDIKNKKENKYNKGYKNKRINKIFNKSRDEKYEVDIFEIHGCILNFEQFRFYTLRCYGLEPYDIKKLNLDERDILIRYAVNLGSQEINYYIVHKIFGSF